MHIKIQLNNFIQQAVKERENVEEKLDYSTLDSNGKASRVVMLLTMRVLTIFFYTTKIKIHYRF